MWPMRTVLLTALLQCLQVSSGIQCPGSDLVCPTGHSCCRLENRDYGCCPFPDAVCCPNKLHCCPVGFECNVTDRSCVKAGKKLPAGKPLPAKPVTALVIPTTSVKIMQPSNAYKHVWCDRTVACKDGSTCCKNKDNQWMCCPFPQAVCCSDHLHCCPIHTKCKQGGLKCLSGNILFSAAIKIPTYLPSEASFFLKKSSKSVNLKPETIVCPDGQSECPDGNTCCKLSSGQYGCCPLPKAVCCSDGVHCCPNGYTCDVSEGTCSRKAENVPLLIKQPAKPTKIKTGSVVCPDGQSECPDGNTCCRLSSGQFGCCPLPKAVCCSDGVHCCPNGYTCDVSAGTCSKNSKQLRLLLKQPAKPTKIKTGSIICPDGQSECPDGNTCCELSSGDYGCCPLPKAMCCSDGIHCCPNGYTCDVSAGTCNKNTKQLRLLLKQPAKPTKIKTESIVCPGGKSECPSANTCCRLRSGEYGCCPLPNAMCCSDGIHCCPEGYTCDVSAGTCNKNTKQLRLPLEQPAKPTKIKTGNVVCPGGQSECPNGNTCCKLSSEEYGCCPLPKAVCCSDGVHCCPNGYTCDVSEGTCSRKAKNVPLLIKQRAKPTKIKTGNVICPDEQSQCPDGNTCCKLSSGEYGCCPLPKAVCCSDGVHCCPNGYTCDVSEGTCSRKAKNVPLLIKQRAKPTKIKTGNVICPDEQSQCPDGNTCCKLSSGEYGCCPLPKAVCCSDGIHCCPNGYTCDVSEGTCSRKAKNASLLIKQPTKATKIKTGNVVCPGGQSQCPNGNTCCRLSSGGYGCCPLPKAVCCSDRIHCCPNGYTCDVSAGTCNKNTRQLRLPLKQPAKPTKTRAGSIVCPDEQSECPDGNTCCKLKSGQYGCCPLPDAVCCSDGIHCCPEGYTCDVSEGTCNKGLKKFGFFQKMSGNLLDEKSKENDQRLPKILLQVTEKVNYIFCPDGSVCLFTETCCMAPDGYYSCCAFRRAVCCADRQHCCPSQYRCDLSRGLCIPAENTHRMVTKTSSLRRSRGPIVRPSLTTSTIMTPVNENTEELKLGSKGKNIKKHKIHVEKGALDEKLVFSPTKIKVFKTSVKSVTCEEESCNAYHTCCPTPSGKGHCCPLPQASCCTDGQHCCPQGFVCSHKTNKCERNSLFMPLIRNGP